MTGKVRNHRRDCVTLRIKKVYFDRILSGEKTAEYRDFKPYYQRLFTDRETPVKYLYLHYQTDRGLVVQVKGIEAIKTPDRLKDSGIKFGPKVFKIDLGKAKLT